MSGSCSNETWAVENGATVDWARHMWVCLDACDKCEGR